MKATWKFQALQLGHAFVWLWIACDDSGAIKERSVRNFPSYRAMVGDATDHGFNVAQHHWELLNPVDAPIGPEGRKRRD